ncbi:MAG TPA: FAD-linked oxidase C-terminal domain-containing protein [Polyangiaceae bacterium]|jgi:FAD/FMN-containing dehydrogenase/Fe-S oxidoreductase
MNGRGGARLIPAERLKRAPPRAYRHAESPAAHAEVDVRALWKRLRETVEGDVRFDPGTLGLYAQDASNYYHLPIGVVLPKSADDVAAVLAACRSLGVPVVSRTGGTALAGQGCNEALVLDFSKYMRHIIAIDPDSRIARVEPGVICDELTAATKPHGLTWGPKPATHSRCGFGGMLSNNCGGMNAQYSGIAVHNVEALDVILYDGTRMHLGWMNEDDLADAIAAGGRPGEVYRALRELRDRYRSRIVEGYPRLPRRVSGYNLDELVPKADGRFNVPRAIVGTEGTCVTIVEATLRLVDLRPQRVVAMLAYDDIFRAADHVPSVLAAEPDPMAVEGMDQRLYDHAKKKNQPSAKHLALLPKGHAWLFVQIGSNDKAESRARGERLIAALRPELVDARVLEEDEDQENLWEMREDSLGTTAFVPGERDTWEGWEDSAVPPERLGDYLRDLDALYHRYGYSSALYGHFGQGLVHCRVNFDLASHEGIHHFHAFLEEASDLVAQKYGGSLSGEHGDGQSKAEFLRKMFGPELVHAFAEFKAIWDPTGRMNPGKVVHPRRPDQDLRLGATYDPAQPRTHFQFPQDGGSFAHATLRCVGIGRCRAVDSSGGGVMCPSYMVTEEERHSTRGRTHLLWEMLRGGGPITRGFRDESVKEALDLCLACKGCKSDCPTNVDMATYKAEFLSHYFEHRLRPRHAYAFGLIDKWARLASLAPGLANLTTQLPGVRALAKRAAGVHPKRSIPPFAPQTFRQWFAKRPKPAESPNKVLLWADTFNNYFHPEVARGATRLLEHLGYQVLLPSKPLCCGRPLYDFGMLTTAEHYLEKTLAALKPHIDAGIPMVVLEPSCCSVFRDELTELMPARIEANKLKAQTFMLSEFLHAHVDPARIPKLRRRALVQTHCHHHAVIRFDAEKEIFAAMGLECEVLKSGCCGMAGSFGFEEDKYDVAQACGERVLLPRVREATPETLILADGFSCKTQLAENGARRGVHLAEALEMALDHGEAGPAAHPFVESSRTETAQLAVRRSMARALVGVVVGLVLVVWAVLWLLLS